MSETFIVNQIQYTIDLGYQVLILVTDFKKENTPFFEVFLNQEVVKKNIKIIDYNIPRSKLKRLFVWFYLILLNTNNLRSIIEFYKYSKNFSLSNLFKWHYYYYKIVKEYDIVHVQFGTKSHPMDFFKKYHPNFKLIVSFHGHDSFFPINGFIQNNGYYNLLFKHADIINTNTHYLTKQLIKIGCSLSKIAEIPVAVNPELFPYKEKESNQDKLRLITVGRLHPIKGHKYLIDLVKVCKQKGIDVILTIVGSGELKEDLECEIKEKQLVDSILLVGAKSQTEVKELYYQNDIFVFSSVPFKGREETQGLVSLEAQSCGLPIVAFDSGGVKYTFKNNESGFLINVYDVEFMAKKISVLNENRELIRKMGEKGKEFVKNQFSVSIIKNKWEKIYNSKGL